jgi:hypothetical protein
VGLKYRLSLAADYVDVEDLPTTNFVNGGDK